MGLDKNISRSGIGQVCLPVEVGGIDQRGLQEQERLVKTGCGSRAGRQVGLWEQSGLVTNVCGTGQEYLQKRTRTGISS